jgi:peptidyl serine alpha-galactosyltransferase
MICRFSNSVLSPDGKDAFYTPWRRDPKEEPSAPERLHTVFSTDGSLYQRWQADLLAYSHRKVRQPGSLTRLFSADGPPTPFAGTTFQTEPYSTHPLTGDYYPANNKVMALKAWLEEAPPAEELVLLIDPDCIFLQPQRESVSYGAPIAHPIGYLDPSHEQNLEFVRKHCSRPKLAQALGIPILIHRDDLAALSPRWLEKTEEIRNDSESREHAGWLAEMWGYIFAAAEIGLKHNIRKLARYSTENQADLPIIHYCYITSDAAKQWVWNKRTYRPWERVPYPPDKVPLATKALIGVLNEWVAMQEHQFCLH